MKAIAINPMRREISGVEIDPRAIRSAFDAKAILLQAVIGKTHMLYYDGRAGHADCFNLPPFWFAGYAHAIHGKGILLGRKEGQWPVATTLTVREVECLVRFRSGE